MPLAQRLMVIEATNRCTACMRPTAAHENGVCEARECRDCPGQHHHAWLCPVNETRKIEERRNRGAEGAAGQLRSEIRVVSPKRRHQDTPRPTHREFSRNRPMKRQGDRYPARRPESQRRGEQRYGYGRRDHGDRGGPLSRSHSRYDERDYGRYRREDERNRSKERRDYYRRERSDSGRSFESNRGRR